ncbi:TPA: chalcone isomerase family protein [Pseudomonas aeruginosa]
MLLDFILANYKQYKKDNIMISSIDSAVAAKVITSIYRRPFTHLTSPDQASLHHRLMNVIGVCYVYCLAVTTLVAIAFSGTASADPAPSPFPNLFSSSTKQLVLNGVAERKSLSGVSQYAVALYLFKHSDNAVEIVNSDTDRAVVIRFSMDMSTQRARTILLEDLFVNLEKNQLQALFPDLNKLMSLAPGSGFTAGDTAVFSYTPKIGTQISMNGIPLGTVEGKVFIASFLTQWLGPRPTSRLIKSRLLGSP